MTTPNETNTIRLHRVLRATPERVYRAFLDPEAKVKWLPPHGFTAKVHHLDAKVGGTYKMSFTNFTTGKSHTFGGTYVELTPHERIRYTDREKSDRAWDDRIWPARWFPPDVANAMKERRIHHEDAKARRRKDGRRSCGRYDWIKIQATGPSCLGALVVNYRCVLY